MTNPDPPAEAATSRILSPVDPVIAVQLILTEAEYLRMQATLMITAQELDATRSDLSPLGR
jgi:hypothetical protein